MVKRRCVMAFASLLVLAACEDAGNSSQIMKPAYAPEPPPQNVMTRDDITDFCDSVPQDIGDDYSATESRTLKVAEVLGANSEQATAMSMGALEAIVEVSVAEANVAFSNFTGRSTTSRDDEKSFESSCRAKVREKLFELSEK